LLLFQLEQGSAQHKLASSLRKARENGKRQRNPFFVVFSFGISTHHTTPQHNRLDECLFPKIETNILLPHHPTKKTLELLSAKSMLKLTHSRESMLFEKREKTGAHLQLFFSLSAFSHTNP